MLLKLLGASGYTFVFVSSLLLSSCFEDNLASNEQHPGTPFKIEATNVGYHDRQGNSINGVIPLGAKAEVTVEFVEGKSPVDKNSLEFYYVLLPADEVFNPPFSNYNEFRIMAQSFRFDDSSNERTITLENKDYNSASEVEFSQLSNDHIGTVYGIYIIPDDPNYIRHYNFEHPTPDFVAPKGVGTLNLPDWLASSGKWINKDPNSNAPELLNGEELYIKFINGATIDEVEMYQNIEYVGLEKILYFNEGHSPNYSFMPMQKLYGGGAFSEFGFLPNDEGVYAKLEIVHSNHMGKGSFIIFILRQGSNYLEVEGYNSLSKSIQRGELINSNPKYLWSSNYPPRYRVTP